MQKTRNNCFEPKKRSTTLLQEKNRQARVPKCNSNVTVAVTFRQSRLPVFAWRRVMLHFSTRNNCCEFLAFYGVNTQSVVQSFLKTPVCGASLSVTDNIENQQRHYLNLFQQYIWIFHKHFIISVIINKIIKFLIFFRKNFENTIFFVRPVYLIIMFFPKSDIINIYTYSIILYI